MKDNFDLQNETDWKKLASWLVLAMVGGLWWWSIFSNGFGITIIWTIVVIALCALWFNMRDNRL